MTSIVLFYTGFPILRGALVSLRAGQPNMDLLVSLAATSAYVYSTAAVLVGIRGVLRRDDGHRDGRLGRRLRSGPGPATRAGPAHGVRHTAGR